MITPLRALPQGPKDIDNLIGIVRLIKNPKEVTQAALEFEARRDEIQQKHTEAQVLVKQAIDEWAAIEKRGSELDQKEEDLIAREEALQAKQAKWGGRCTNIEAKQAEENQRLVNMAQDLMRVRDELAEAQKALDERILKVSELAASVVEREAAATTAQAKADEVLAKARALVG